jgi:hypothetical protein
VPIVSVRFNEGGSFLEQRTIAKRYNKYVRERCPMHPTLSQKYELNIKIKE